MTPQSPVSTLAPFASPAEPLAADAKQALRRMAGAVSVIGCRRDGQNHAMTATSVTALSMAPPSMLVCINQAANFHEAIERAEVFSINILSRAQVDISKACSGAAKGEERFRLGDWAQDGLAPVLRGAQASIVCRKDGTMRYGSHTIFVGRIVAVEFDPVIDPLIYLDGTYSGLPPDELPAVGALHAWYLL